MIWGFKYTFYGKMNGWTASGQLPSARSPRVLLVVPTIAVTASLQESTNVLNSKKRVIACVWNY